jgi:hypothetical protein
VLVYCNAGVSALLQRGALCRPAEETLQGKIENKRL